AGHIVHGGLSPLAGPSGHSPGTSPRSATLTIDEDILNSLLEKNKDAFETRIKALDEHIRNVVNTELQAQTRALNDSFSGFLEAQIGSAVSDSLDEHGKASQASVVTGLETRVGEIKASIASELKAIQKDLQDRISTSLGDALKNNNTTLVQLIIDHMHHPDSALQKAHSSLNLKVDSLKVKVAENTDNITAVVSRVESLERRHGNMVDVTNKANEALRADVEELQSCVPALPAIERCLNQIYQRIELSQRLVEGESESAVEAISLQPEHPRSSRSIERDTETAEPEVLIVQVDKGKGRAKEDEGETRSEGSSIPLPQKVRFEDPATPSPPKSSPPLSGLLLEDVDMAFDDGEQGVSGKGNEEQRDPDSDGSIGSQVAEILLNRLAMKWMNGVPPQPLVLNRMMQSSQLSEEETSQEVLEIAVGKASGQKESKIAKAKRRRTSSSATEVPTAKEGSPTPDQSTQAAEDSE
ncbi:hypothetical protein BC826DRAFT_976790, partial [Russula brevipes]